MSNLIEIHPSSLTEYADCPRRAAAKMLKKELQESGYNLRESNRVIGASVGTAVHTGAQYTLDYKIDTGTLAPLKETQEKAIDMLSTGIADGKRCAWSGNICGALLPALTRCGLSTR